MQSDTVTVSVRAHNVAISGSGERFRSRESSRVRLRRLTAKYRERNSNVGENPCRKKKPVPNNLAGKNRHIIACGGFINWKSITRL